MALADTYVDPSKQTRTPVTIANSTTTATVTQASHGYSNGDVVKIHNANESEYNGNFTISNVTTDTYDYTMASDPGGSATGSPVASKLNLSGDDGSTSALAYADLQYALDQTTRDTTDGNRFLIKKGTAEVLAKTIDLTGWSASFNYGTCLEGYETTAGDGGIAEIDVNGGLLLSTHTVSSFKYLEIHNADVTSSASIINAANVWTHAYRCYFHDCGAFSTGTMFLHECAFSSVGNTGGSAFGGQQQMRMIGCYVEVDSAEGIATVISNNASTSEIRGNCILIKSGETDVDIIKTNTGNDSTIFNNNSILCLGANVGAGIELGNAGWNRQVMYNLIEGCSGTGGIGINYAGRSEVLGTSGKNAVYNCATEYTTSGASLNDIGDDEILSASPFAKSGTITLSDFVSDNAGFWASVAAYFEPQDTGNVFGNFGSLYLTKGAVPRPARTVSPSRHPLARF
jgi:hypothetical protein